MLKPLSPLKPPRSNMSIERGDVRYVVCAANRNKYGHIICGARHFDRIMHTTMQMLDQYREESNTTGQPDVDEFLWKTSEQGFIDQHGVFLTREEAWVVAS